MSINTQTMATAARPRSTTTRQRAPDRSSESSLDQFERVYTSNVEVVMGYFARRCGDPQTVDDLTSETFVRAAEGFCGFDPKRGSARAWVFGIATHVFAGHCERSANGRDAVDRLAGDRSLAADEIEELTMRIDAERDAAVLMQRFHRLPIEDRVAIELVDFDELTPKEAAAALGISRVALRQRLFRARSRMRKDQYPS